MAAGSVRPIITLGLPSPQPYGVHSTEPALGHRVILWFVQGCDHSPSDCAMTFLWHPVCQGPPSRSTQICLSWNDGSCAATPGPCFQLHFCAICGNPHPRAKECKDTPIDIRVNERDWQRGWWVGPIYVQFMCYEKVGKLGF